MINDDAMEQEGNDETPRLLVLVCAVGLLLELALVWLRQKFEANPSRSFVRHPGRRRVSILVSPNSISYISYHPNGKADASLVYRQKHGEVVT
jgi:hypothetical protein